MMNLLQFVVTCNDVLVKQSLDLSCLHDLPCYVYMKDNSGRYIGVNHYLTKDVGLSNEADLLGATDFDLCQEKTADKLIKNDKVIMTKEQANTFVEPIIFLNNKKVTSISYKTLLRSRNKKILGVIGLSIVQESITPQVSAQQNSIEIIMTAREKEVVHYLIRGYTAREIAAKLALSRRTVEHHIENIKNKAGAQTKSELIETIIDLYGLYNFTI